MAEISYYTTQVYDRNRTRCYQSELILDKETGQYEMRIIDQSNGRLLFAAYFTRDEMAAIKWLMYELQPEFGYLE